MHVTVVMCTMIVEVCSQSLVCIDMFLCVDTAARTWWRLLLSLRHAVCWVAASLQVCSPVLCLMLVCLFVQDSLHGLLVGASLDAVD
jgi:hypothetical protein